jgi:hypothetical protein
MPVELAQRIEQEKSRALALLAAMQSTIDRLQLNPAVTLPEYSSSRFTLEKDPYTQSVTLCCRFYANPHYRCGQLLFHGNGQCFGEYDVGLPHPRLAGLFIEAVEGWGTAEAAKAELRLLEMPGD